MFCGSAFVFVRTPGPPHVPDMPKEYRPVAPMEAAGRYFLNQFT
jgi:hypothetical protein